MDLFLALVEKFWVPLLTTLITAAINAALAQRAKVIAFLSHASDVPLLGLAVPPPAPPPAGQAAPPPQGQAAAAPGQAGAPAANAAVQPPIIHTHSILLRNIGKRTAFNLRIGHHQQVILGYQVSPTMTHTVSRI